MLADEPADMRLVADLMRRCIVTYGEMVMAPVLAVAFIIAALQQDGSVNLFALIAGSVCFTFAEYLVHRFGLHGFARAQHWTHHRDPGVAVETIFWPIWVGLIVADWLAGSVFVAGALLAYAAYLGVHHASHHSREHRSKTLLALIAHHDEHHRHGSVNFGVSNTVWDRLFGTKA